MMGWHSHTHTRGLQWDINAEPRKPDIPYQGAWLAEQQSARACVFEISFWSVPGPRATLWGFNGVLRQCRLSDARLAWPRMETFFQTEEMEGKLWWTSSFRVRAWLIGSGSVNANQISLVAAPLLQWPWKAVPTVWESLRFVELGCPSVWLLWGSCVVFYLWVN